MRRRAEAGHPLVVDDARRTMNLLGTRMRSRETTAALVSSSRRRAAVISMGCRPLLKVLAKAPLTPRSRPLLEVVQ